MALSKHQENQLLEVYNSYWEYYLEGSPDKMVPLLDENYSQIGSAEKEVFSNKADAVKFLRDTINQIAGQLEMRNREVVREELGSLQVFHEKCDVFVKTESEWVFYSKFRATMLMQLKEEKWKLIHQHSSFPDSRTDEGENVAIDKVAEENKELREAIRRRTVELELKNQDLAIEAALERVRSRSMAMYHTSELHEVIHTVHQELLKLQIGIFGGSFIAINSEIDEELRCWGAGGTANASEEVYIPFFDKPFYTNLLTRIKAGPEFFTEEFTQKEKMEFFTFLFDHEPWSTLDIQQKSEVLSSEGGYTRSCCVSQHTSIFIINQFGKKFTEAENDILKRFAKVFEQTYTRFLDLQKAEAQAREAKIEMALERVRSRTMAMHHSNELMDASKVLFEQLNNIGFEAESSWITLVNPEENSEEIWATHGPQFSVKQVKATDHPNFKAEIDAWKNKVEFLKFSNTKENFIETVKAVFDFDVKDQKDKSEFYLLQIRHRFGFLGLGTWEETNQEEYQVYKRFAKVFEQTYTRFLDLQKAEAQSREAQINLAVERVRAKALAMFKSEEIMEVVAKLKEEVMSLDIPDVIAATIFLNEGKDKVRMWDLSAVEKVNNGYQLPFDISFKFKIHDPNLYVKRVWENPANFFLEIQEEKDFKRYVQWLSENNKPKVADKIEAYIEATQLKRLHHVVKKLNNGKLAIDLLNPPSDEMESILTKMGAAFDLAYKRFEDLQKAETQARESEIELALERIRARTMAMQHSEELQDAAIILFEQVKALGFDTGSCGFNIWEESKKDAIVWVTSPEGGMQLPFRLPHTESAIYKAVLRASKSGEAYRHELSGDALRKHFDYLCTIPGIGDIIQNLRSIGYDFPQLIIYQFAFFKQGYLSFHSHQESADSSHIFKRFAKVFEQTYTRFLDLQKAEAQAREAQIEAALERVRARTMAMQKSKELTEAAALLYHELSKLGIEKLATGYTLFDETEEMGWNYGVNPLDGSIRHQPVGMLHTETKVMKSIAASWGKKEHFLIIELNPKETIAHQSYIAKSINFPISKKHLLAISPKALVIHTFNFKQGYLLLVGGELLTGEQREMVVRFAKVFEQTYTRFLDLQKAEAQTREAKIEAALEKIRSRSLAMHKPEELKDVVIVLVEKLKELGVVLDANGVILCTYFQNSKDILHWIASPDFSFAGSYLLPYFDHPILEDAWESKESGTDYFSKAFTVEEKNSFFEHAFEHSDYRHFPDDFKKWVFQNDKHTLSFAWQKNSAILIPSHTGIVPNEAEREILKRFSNVFEQAYVRFMDLQKAEAQAKEATKQASLERVRGEIASMRSTEDLLRITPLVFNELTTLGVPFIRCGVFIIQEQEEKIEVYLSAPDGHSLGVLNLAFDSNELTTNSVAHWRKKKVYHKHWSKTEFVAWARSMVEQGQVQNQETYQGAETPPESLDLHFIPFSQGMLYVGNVSKLNEEEIDLVKSIAKAFSIAYARYEDFAKLEHAKQSIENTLSELKAAQSQLIQSEKMASLGELTAGIAHEIQNPLNFVNNFSEVSNELIDEIEEERAKSQEPRV